jgi:hypothetical protein
MTERHGRDLDKWIAGVTAAQGEPELRSFVTGWPATRTPAPPD